MLMTTYRIIPYLDISCGDYIENYQYINQYIVSIRLDIIHIILLNSIASQCKWSIHLLSDDFIYKYYSKITFLLRYILTYFIVFVYQNKLFKCYAKKKKKNMH